MKSKLYFFLLLFYWLNGTFPFPFIFCQDFPCRRNMTFDRRNTSIKNINLVLTDSVHTHILWIYKFNNRKGIARHSWKWKASWLKLEKKEAFLGNFTVVRVTNTFYSTKCLFISIIVTWTSHQINHHRSKAEMGGLTDCILLFLLLFTYPDLLAVSRCSIFVAAFAGIERWREIDRLRK